MAKAQHEREYQGLPDLLRKMREDAGLTQRELATKVGKTQGWVWKSEVAIRRMDITEFVLWCNGCGKPPKDGFDQVLALVAQHKRKRS